MFAWVLVTHVSYTLLNCIVTDLLPGLHAYTETDLTTALKLIWYYKANIINTFSKVCDQIDIQQSTLCTIYGKSLMLMWFTSSLISFNSNVPQRNSMIHLKESMEWTLVQCLHVRLLMYMEACSPNKSKSTSTWKTWLDIDGQHIPH